MVPSSLRASREYSASTPAFSTRFRSAAAASARLRMTRGAYGHASPSTVGSHCMAATLGCHGSTMYESGSGMARMSGSAGVCPMGPAANPANPAPSVISPSRLLTGTSLAQGLPCISTNMA